MVSTLQHAWTDDDYRLLERYHDGLKVKQLAEMIGAPPGTVTQYLHVRGITRERTGCLVCTGPLPPAQKTGPKPQYCSTRCKQLLKQAHQTNVRIDARVIHCCEECGTRLKPPWTTKKRWCSRVCSHRGWYKSVLADSEKAKAQRDRLALAKDRSDARTKLTSSQSIWLLNLRTGHTVTARQRRVLRDRLMLDNDQALTRYAKAVKVA